MVQQAVQMDLLGSIENMAKRFRYKLYKKRTSRIEEAKQEGVTSKSAKKESFKGRAKVLNAEADKKKPPNSAVTRVNNKSENKENEKNKPNTRLEQKKGIGPNSGKLGKVYNNKSNMVSSNKSDDTIPGLIPARGPNHCLKKLINNQLQNTTNIYCHVWLDCLTSNEEVSFNGIRDQLAPLFDTREKRNLIKQDSIYILGHKGKDGVIRLTGSCFIRFEDSIKRAFQGLDNFEYSILHCNYRMIIVESGTVRYHNNFGCLLIFSDGFQQKLKTFPAPSIRKYCMSSLSWYKSLETEVKTVVKTVDNRETVVTTRDLGSTVQPTYRTTAIYPIPYPMGPAFIPQHLMNAEPSCSIQLEENSNEIELDDDDFTEATSSNVKKDNDCTVGTSKASKNDVIKGDFIRYNDSLSRSVEAKLSLFENERRYVAIILDKCFQNLSFDIIKFKYDPFIGPIKRDSVFLISDSYQEGSVDGGEIYSKAVIVAPKGVKPSTDQLIAKGIAIGEVYIENLSKRLSRGECLVVANAFTKDNMPIHKRAKGSDENNPIENGEKGKSTNQSKPMIKQVVKPARMLANVCQSDNHNRVTKAKQIANKTKIVSEKSRLLALEQKRMIAAEGVSNFIGRTMARLQKFGNVVVRVDNLPAKLTVHTLNLMMGTCSFKGDQIIAAQGRQVRGKETMNIRLVADRNLDDLNRVKAKDKLKTVYNDVLSVRVTDFKELERFLKENHSRMIKLSDSLEMAAKNNISYSYAATISAN